jgi:thioredoxin reductase
MHTIVVIGGSVAGLSAALTLGRMRREVLVIDSGEPCNRFSHASHGFLSRDGIAPADLLAEARAQLAAYSSVRVQHGRVTAVHAQTGDTPAFTVALQSGELFEAGRLLLAHGLHDELPAQPGFRDLWGHGVYHCGYCDGWENRDRPLAVLGHSEHPRMAARILRQLSADVVLCTDGERLSDEARAELAQHGIGVREERVSHLVGDAAAGLHGVAFDDGEVLPRGAIFVMPHSTLSVPFAAQLGCTISEQGRISVDMLGRTSVTGVYAAGDIIQMMRQVSAAVASGQLAAVGINTDLVFEAVPAQRA